MSRRLVYTTDRGRVTPPPDRCPGCQRPSADCVCRDRARVTGDGIVRLERQTKGRKGAGVTRITGLAMTESQLKTLARSLKASCGVGGGVKDGVIELQGDQRDKLLGLLDARGIAARKAGG